MVLPFPWNAGTPAGDAMSTFVDPSITGQHGYVSVTPLLGNGNVIMVTSQESSTGGVSSRASLEAWRTAPSRFSGVGVQGGLGGAGEWMCHTAAYVHLHWHTPAPPRLHACVVITTCKQALGAV